MATSSKLSQRAEVDGEIGDQANQPVSFAFPKRKFGEKNPVSRLFQSSWFKKQPWLNYDAAEDSFLFRVHEVFEGG